AEVHARTPDAGVETGSRGVGEAGLQGGILVGLRDATPDVIGNGGHFPGERRLLLRGRDERDGGQQDGERSSELEGLHPWISSGGVEHAGGREPSRFTNT